VSTTTGGAEGTRTTFRPIFVVGAPRSGTTLVQCILSANSGAYSLPETHFFSRVVPRLRLKPSDRVDPSTLERIRALMQVEAELDLPDTAAKKLLASLNGSGTTAVDVFRAYCDARRPDWDESHALRLVEKTPLHVLALDDIADAFVGAQFINVIRHPLLVAASWHKTPFRSNQSVLLYARTWSAAIGCAAEFERRHPDRILSIRYEDLTAEPERAVSIMSEFTGLDNQPEMLGAFAAEVQHALFDVRTFDDLAAVAIEKCNDVFWRGGRRRRPRRASTSRTTRRRRRGRCCSRTTPPSGR